MITDILIREKSFGDKVLYKDLALKLQEGEKVGLIGRNGTGKSTLFNLLAGLDTDFDGNISLKKGTQLVFSRQEHHGFEEHVVMEYILADLPEYTKLKHVIETYPEHMGESTHKLQVYSDALERFADLGYYDVENGLEKILSDYQISSDVIHKKIKELSGGQKRLIELVKIQRSRADLALIDEPTNHMDYVAKDSFISWLNSAREAVVVITHDRDVLKNVDRIIEIRDNKALSFKGNYDTYLKLNVANIGSAVNEYEVAQRNIANLKADVIRFKRLKEKSRDPDTIKRFKGQEQRAAKALADLEATTEKPTVWVDRESVAELGTKLGESYEQHKARNIIVRTKTGSDKSDRVLLRVDNLRLGYGDDALFSSISFDLRVHSKTELRGRNGAGKTTIVRSILDTVAGKMLTSKVFSGVIDHEKSLRIGVYEQEISSEYLNMKLGVAIEQLYIDRDLSIASEKVRQLLSDYLFNPHTDYDTPIERLSGGQKARFQLIGMLAGDPQILILDEPTNHLDLPSIEELEDALNQYHGAILYISHDSYFRKNIGGTVVLI
jgi:ATP-binding cassette subfamily F protein 3